MNAFLTSLVLACAPTVAGNGEIAGTVYNPAFVIDDHLRLPSQSYFPQNGDIFFTSNRIWIIRKGHDWAGAGSPHHSGIIFQNPEGRWCTLEAGPHETLRVKVLDMQESLTSYTAGGDKVWIRRRHVPLTPQQCQQLCDFAMAQHNKRFALGRVLLQVTPFRCRGTFRTDFLGKCCGERKCYYCAELVTEACVAAGMFPRERVRPGATYPCDLFFGKSEIPFINEHMDVNSSWEPPARWTAESALSPVQPVAHITE